MITMTRIKKHNKAKSLFPLWPSQGDMERDDRPKTQIHNKETQD